MTWFGCANGRTLIVLAACWCPALLFQPLSAQAVTLEEKRATRMERIGLQIASIPSYSVHADTAVRKDGKLLCAASRSRADIQAEHDQLEAQKQRLTQEHDRRLSELTQQRNQAQSRETFVRIQEQMDAISEEYGVQFADITEQQKALWRDPSAGRLALTLLHQPDDRTTTILPLQNGAPTDGFLSDLNRSVGAFLATCEGAALATVSHYYRDGFRYGDADAPAISFRYNIENDRLIPVPCDTPTCQAIMRTQGNSADPRENPDLTLAGFIRSEQEKAREAGDYRKAFAYQAGRKDGIVYKLDPYWAQYEAFEFTRRIFDGDFDGYADWTEFKMTFMGLATEYSDTCKAYVNAWQTYERIEDIYDRTEFNLDGSRTIHQTRQTKTITVDRRFTPQYAQYGPQVNADMLEKGVVEGFNLLLAYRAQVKYFFEQHACDSATTRQLTENFIRAANGQPSVQEAGLRFAGAAGESDAPTKTGRPPARFTPVANAKEENETVNAAIAAFGGGGLFGEDWKTPTMSEDEFNQNVERVSGDGQDNFNRAAREAERALDALEEPSEAAAPAIKQRDQSQQTTARLTVSERRERIRRIDQETNEQVQAIMQAQHQAQVEAANEFRQKMTTASIEEQTRLLEEYRQQQSAEREQMRVQVQELRAEADERKKQL